VSVFYLLLHPSEVFFSGSASARIISFDDPVLSLAVGLSVCIVVVVRRASGTSSSLMVNRSKELFLIQTWVRH
jgi:hypothetical protein